MVGGVDVRKGGIGVRTCGRRCGTTGGGGGSQPAHGEGDPSVCSWSGLVFDKESPHMPNVNRWRRAQDYEQEFWEGVAAQISAGAASQLDWYRWRAGQLLLKLRSLGLNNPDPGQAPAV